MSAPPFSLSSLTRACRLSIGSAARERAELLQRAMAKWQTEEAARRVFTEKYGHGRAPVASKMDDKWVVAIGSSLYKQTQEGNYSLINVIHDHALDFFGLSFLEEDETKPVAEQHVALKWMRALVDENERERERGGGGAQAMQTGDAAAWGRFGYDLFTIADNSALQKALRRRLTSGRDFQGARHELRVAALCVVAGFALDYEDEADGSKTHPEFLGKDRFSGVHIAVEAKSRHRHGVQGFAGGHAIDPGERVGIRGLVLDALQKQTGLPFYVFIDTNLPPCDEDTYRRWMDEIGDTMRDLEAEGLLETCPANGIFFSNDPSHYLGQAPIGGAEDRLWIRSYAMAHPRTPHPVGDLSARFMKAHEQRLAPPKNILGPW